MVDFTMIGDTSDLCHIPTTPGSYLLIFHLPVVIDRFVVGKLGVFSLHPGHWLYAGSAWGPGGLRSRLRRHFQPEKQAHWHIDFLSNHLPPIAFLALEQTERSVRLECAWIQRLLRQPGFSAPIPHFGSSDCGSCPAHLVYTEGIRDRGLGLFIHRCEPTATSGREWTLDRNAATSSGAIDLS
ncbi:MAG: GIY-YIG nuclease family protein [Caldilineaceae bacterium]|nr:GIY-YIG nuclease family protein [Caldilineaceae bacterium]